ncbi:sulfotransferase [Rubrobacter xylanophilus]|uniref:sulfotransferase n=1 Tax=Rubrobacter xylanophilus TaxID=49319 RepID=UPI00155A50D7|nr:sulfotransferase [Rubrobacter xylanophilus]
MKLTRERVARQQREIESLRRRMEELEERAVGGDGLPARPENFVWIFGTGRSGSTWLGRMLRDLRGNTLWNEPLVGYMLGQLYHVRGEYLHDNPNFLLGGPKETWLPSVRRFILDAAAAKFPRHAAVPSRRVVVKEPHGSMGASIISEALPESRMILLVRDPRDVVASRLDAHRSGSWARKGVRPDGREDEYVERDARVYVRDMGHAEAAYEMHPGPKTTVRYEDLRADPLGGMRALLSALSIPFREEDLAAVVERHAWENIPEEEKGPGKIRRKAKPGGWREDLTPEQAKAVERVAASYIERFYPD